MTGLFTYEPALLPSLGLVLFMQSVELYTCVEKLLNLAHFAKSETFLFFCKGFMDRMINFQHPLIWIHIKFSICGLFLIDVYFTNLKCEWIGLLSCGSL